MVGVDKIPFRVLADCVVVSHLADPTFSGHPRPFQVKGQRKKVCTVHKVYHPHGSQRMSMLFHDK